MQRTLSACFANFKKNRCFEEVPLTNADVMLAASVTHVI
jgi:hypothetical protein